VRDIAVAVFVLSAAAIVYTLAGYPLLLLALTAAKRRDPPMRAWTPRTVTVLLAVYNGEAWIGRKIESLLSLDYPPELIHILVLDDGSTDRTAEILRGVADPRVEHVGLPHGGKAGALNAGLRRATGEILFFTDVRQALDPLSLRRLVERFADPAVGVVSGELMIGAGGPEGKGVGLYWRYEKWMRQRLSDIDSVAGATGCIYAMRRALAVPLPPDTLVDDMYLPLAAFLRGHRVVFESQARAFDEPASLGGEFRRKVRTLAGNIQILVDLPRLLSPSNRMLFHFLSHKIARLLLPYALILLGVSSFALPQPYRTAAVAAQACFYLAALGDVFVPAGWRLKRVTGIARTFVVLMAATLCAPAALVLARRTVWGTTR
jgi:poly-beta-1,6-N-acetyl-D-glucosamine synthase